MRARWLLLAVTCLLPVGCAAKQKPEPIEITVTTPSGQTRTVTAYVFVPTTEDVLVKVGIAAGGRAKQLAAARTLGVLEPVGASLEFTRMVEAVRIRYGYRGIPRSDYKVVCSGGSGSAGSISKQAPTCSMFGADAVLHFSYVRTTRDSGFVAAGITKVPAGQTRPEVTFYCIRLARVGRADEWTVARSERIYEERFCPKQP